MSKNLKFGVIVADMSGRSKEDDLGRPTAMRRTRGAKLSVTRKSVAEETSVLNLRKAGTMA